MLESTDERGLDAVHEAGSEFVLEVLCAAFGSVNLSLLWMICLNNRFAGQSCHQGRRLVLCVKVVMSSEPSMVYSYETRAIPPSNGGATFGYTVALEVFSHRPPTSHSGQSLCQYHVSSQRWSQNGVPSGWSGFSQTSTVSRPLLSTGWGGAF